MDDANIEFKCPGCEQSISFSVTDMGTIQECKHCGGYVDVPGGKDTILPDDPDCDRQLEDYDRQTAENFRQLEVSKTQQQEQGRQTEKDGELQEQQVRLNEKWSQTIDDVNALVAKWSSLAERVETHITGREKDEKA